MHTYMCIRKRGTAEPNDNAVSVEIERSECVRARVRIYAYEYI